MSLSGFFAGSALAALVALLIERIFGFPQSLYRLISHPAVWMGTTVSSLEKRLNRPVERSARLRGIFAMAILLIVTAAVTLPLTWLIRSLPYGFLAEGLLAASLLAQMELGRRVADVARALGQGIEEGRRAVGHVVGRDTSGLDESNVARAAIESLAENTSDGVVAPLFWLIIAGLPGAALYKAINTADSMIGYRSERYRDFGWAAACLDDLVNWPAARLTALFFAVAATFSSGSCKSALAAMRRDAPRHASPNAGWPEAALAGALGFRLGGPRSYQGQMVDHANMGDGRAELKPADIQRALTLYRGALDMLAGATLALVAILLV